MKTYDAKVRRMHTLDSRLINISEDDLLTRQTRFDVRKGFPIHKWVPKSDGDGLIRKKIREAVIDEHVFLYLPVEKGNRQINLFGEQGYVSVSLDPNKYGFPSGEQVCIDPEPVGFELNRRSQILYNTILSKKSHGANFFFDAMAKIINSSMRYDVNKLIERFGDSGTLSQSVYDYVPVGDEVQVGICADAGPQIRDLLESMNMEDTYGASYVKAQTLNPDATHDTTVVFHKETGHWAVLNSKSATKAYNLTPEDKLPELASPYFNYK